MSETRQISAQLRDLLYRLSEACKSREAVYAEVGRLAITLSPENSDNRSRYEERVRDAKEWTGKIDDLHRSIEVFACCEDWKKA